MTVKRLPSIFPIACALLLSLCNVQAETYPSRPIKLVVSLPAGSTPDVIARLAAERLSSRLGQSVIVENRPGAVHTVALKAVAAAVPDGYTLFLGTTGAMTINPALYRDVDFGAGKRLVPIALLATTPNLLAVSPAVPANNFAEFVSYARANPGALTLAAGLGTPPHLLGAYLREKLGLDVLIAPYRGNAQSLPDALSGRIQIVGDSPAVLLPYINQGSLRPLVVTSASRLQELPNVPTMAEIGIDGYPTQTWMGLVAPPGVPESIVERINAAVNETLSTDDMKANLAKLGFSAKGGPAREFAALIEGDARKWLAVVETAKVKLKDGK
jgi:tripartite-type tricarboxylate transporter receptor subunit TctC